MGTFWFKGQFMRTGQANVKHYNRELCALIEHGRAKPSVIISQELKLDDAPTGYKHFDDRKDGWTKVVLHPLLGEDIRTSLYAQLPSSKHGVQPKVYFTMTKHSKDHASET